MTPHPCSMIMRMMEKLDEIDEDELTKAEYAYYVDTMARIQKKLLEVS